MFTWFAGTLYSYLAEGVGHSKGEGAFRALSRGYTQWASGRMEQLEVNTQNPSFCHVRCHMKPSMKPGKYKVHILLGRDGDFATIAMATCECAARYVALKNKCISMYASTYLYPFLWLCRKSATCTHVSALLHALVAMTPTPFNPSCSGDSEVEDLPVTSYPCQWKTTT